MRHNNLRLTESLVGIKDIGVLKICRNGLPPMECSSIPGRGSQGIGLREERFAFFKVLQPHTVHIRCEVAKLAAAVVGMSVEGANEGPELVLARHRPQYRMGVHHFTEFTPYIISSSDFAQDRYQVSYDSISILCAARQ